MTIVINITMMMMIILTMISREKLRSKGPHSLRPEQLPLSSALCRIFLPVIIIVIIVIIIVVIIVKNDSVVVDGSGSQ